MIGDKKRSWWKRLMPSGWLLAALLVLVMGQHLLGQPTRPTQTPASQPAVDDNSFLQLLLKGGWFMAPIAAASLLGVAVILERMVAIRRSRVIPRRAMRELKRVAGERAERPQDALRYCREHPSPLCRIMAAGLRKLPQGYSSAERAIEDAGNNEVHRLRRNLRMLYGLTVVTPMMGLLGTIWGMIEAFRVTSSARGLGRPEMLAKGIYEALVCTLAALMVSIPILLFYYYFMSKIERIIGDLNELSVEFLEHFLENRQSDRRLEEDLTMTSE